MHESRDEGAPPDPAREDGADSAEQAAGPEAPRRAFLRQLSGDAVWTAGRLAGASAVIRRSLLAAGDTAIRGLEETVEPTAPPVEPAGPSSAPAAGVIPAAPVTPPVGIAGPSTSRSAVAVLTPEQQAFLDAGTTAVLAVNDPTGAPLLTTSTYLWDGQTIRLPAGAFTARVSHIDRDPRVSVLIEDPATQAWVAVTGTASLVYGEEVEAMTLAILEKDLSPEAANEQWNELRSTGDRIVIEISPTRFVWRLA